MKGHAVRVAVLALVAFTVAPVGTAVAFPEPDSHGDEDCKSNVVYYFDEGDWPNEDKAAVREGFEQWEEALGNEGGITVDVRESTPDPSWPSGSWSIVDVDHLEGSGYGAADCNNLRIRISPGVTATSTPNLVEIGGHEMGHIFDLHHTGRHDELNTWQDPAMRICDYPTAWTADDEQNLVHKNTGAARPPISANRGFESTYAIGSTIRADWWYAAGSWTTWELVSTGSKNGTYNMRWIPNNGTSYVYQYTNYAEAQFHEIDGRVNYKSQTTATGNITLDIYYRAVTYDDLVAGSCEDRGGYKSGKNQNVRDSVTSWIKMNLTSNSWAALQTWRDSNTDNWILAGADAYDLQIRLYSSVKVGTTYKQVRFDNARLRDVEN